MTSRLHALLALFLVLVSLALGAPAARAQQGEGWQYHFAQANSFYRNKLLPKALAELKVVVEDPEGGKQFKAWQLIIEIATKLKDLDSLMWGLEKGRAVAEGQDAAQMQAQLYRLSRMYGRVVFVTTGGSGRLPNKGVKVKALEEITDPEARTYFEKARVTFSQVGLSKGSYYLPAGSYDIDGEQVKITGGKDTTIEVAPTTTVTFGITAAGAFGGRFGDRVQGASGFLGGIDVGLGPHIQFASGNSLSVRVGPLLLFGDQSTTGVAQDLFAAHSAAKLALGGAAKVAVELRLGQIDLVPSVGYMIQALPSGLYYKGVAHRVVAEGEPAMTVEGDMVVPGLAQGPRIGVEVLVTPGMVKGKRRPRLFVGVQGGPTWTHAQWGDVAVDTQVDSTGATIRGTTEDTSGTLAEGPFILDSLQADPAAATIFGDVQGVVGIQFRL
jgi:hypothetical protein